jgi:hypothetical protein
MPISPRSPVVVTPISRAWPRPALLAVFSASFCFSNASRCWAETKSWSSSKSVSPSAT